MKKKLLLILMFMTMFIVGNKNAYALECKVGEAGCTIDAIKKEVESNSKFLACVYEITVDDNKYYSYIYYDSEKSIHKQKNVFYANSTYKKLDFQLNYSSYNNNLALGNSYDGLEQHVCPEKSYFIKTSANLISKNAICFDNDGGECLEGNDVRDGAYTKTSQKVYDNIENVKYIKDNVLDTDDGDCLYIDIKDSNILKFNLNNNEITWFDMKTGNTYVIPSEDSDSDYKIKGFHNYLTSDYNACPEKVYLFYKNSYGNSKFYDFYDNKSSDILAIYNDKDANISEYKLDKNEDKDVVDNIEGCQLLSDNVIKVINDVMNVIRIAIPLLLIGLIIYDFAMATFASDDKAINKSKQNVIKRIIVAIIIFFVPTFINLVFNLVNEVWANTHLEICGLDEE